MTAPMTDERLAELRKARDEGHPIRYSGSDFRSLLARLDAAEEANKQIAACFDADFSGKGGLERLVKLLRHSRGVVNSLLYDVPEFREGTG